MMENVLSQNEVNALLNAINQGAVNPPEDEVSPDQARPYDLTSNDKVIRGRLPALEIINAKLARNMQISLFNMFRKAVEVTHESTNLMKYSEFINSLPQPACLSVFKMPPLKNRCIMSVDSSFMFGLVDHVFGGNGAWYRVEGREYSAIELRLIKEVVTTILRDLASAWAPVVPKMAPEFINTEVNPQFAQITTPTETTMHITFQVEIESTTRGTISLLIPYSVIEPVRPQLASAIQTERTNEENSWRTEVLRMIPKIEVDVCAKWSSRTITLRQLMNLKVGDQIPLEAAPGDAMVCEIEGVEKAHYFPVKSRRNLAMRFTDEVGARQSEEDR